MKMGAILQKCNTIKNETHFFRVVYSFKYIEFKETDINKKCTLR